MHFQLSTLFFLTTTTAAGIAACTWIGRFELETRGLAMQWFAFVLVLSGLAFTFAPRRWLESPRALYFAWLPWPAAPMLAMMTNTMDVRGREGSAIALFLAAFLAMILPVIIGGMRRARQERSLVHPRHEG